MLVKQKIKYIQSLGQKKFRDESGMFIAEGPKLVAELLEADPASVQEIYGIAEWINGNNNLTSKSTVTEITEAELERISQLSTPNQVLAVIRKYETTIPVVKGQVILALDDIRDPGNMGTIIRIADWFGITQIVCSVTSADIYNPKVVQSTMGSIARVKVYYADLFTWLNEQKDSRIYATVLEGQDVTGMKKIKEGIILVGNESKGISEELMALSNIKITIPRIGEAESLNAAVASGIILSHLC